jgi:hypothetical protein
MRVRTNRQLRIRFEDQVSGYGKSKRDRKMARMLKAQLVICVSFLGFQWFPSSVIAQDKCHGVVILATGTAGYWPDVGTYSVMLESAGISRRVMAPCQRLQTSRWIIQSYESGELREPIVLTGYSQGSGECVRLARRLQSAGIPVTSLLMLEAGGDFEIPGNVRKCLNLYTSNPVTDGIPLLRGLAVHAESPATHLINWDARRFSPDHSELRGQRHLALGNSITARQILTQFMQWDFTQTALNGGIHSALPSATTVSDFAIR